MEYSISHIKTIVGGNYLQTGQLENKIEYLLIDSRKLLFPATTLFFALSGSRRSGHNFINDLYKKGVRSFLVEKDFIFPAGEYPQATIIEVENVLMALQSIATFHRQQFDFPVIAITGSNGKTTVKEWLYQLLHTDFSIVRNPKSYNSQIGVPLSVWQINSQHNLGIFEAGISLPNEMTPLEKIIQPTIGIFTNIGEAHSEGFKNMQQKVLEKLQLFKHCNALIYNKDSITPYIDVEKQVQIINPHICFFSWGKSDTATLQIKNVRQHGLHSTIEAVYQNQTSIEINIPFIDNASIENAACCCCYLLYAGYSPAEMAHKMAQLSTVEMRLQLEEGSNNCSIINDSYSADINSLQIALDFLLQQQQHKHKTVILSDILQSGKSSEILYKNIADMLQQKGIDRLIGIGSEISTHQQAFATIPQKSFYKTTAEFIEHFKTLTFADESILLKGARVFEFEKINRLLELQAHQTVLEINLNAIAHNLQQYQKLLQPQVKVMAMVKAFSYGSGSYEIANLLQFHKVDYLAVAYTDEGVALRKAGITLPIMVMNAEKNTFSLLIKYQLEPEVYSFSQLKAFQDFLKSIAIHQYPIHIKLDTGMHRLGFLNEEISSLANELTIDDTVKLQSVFSHLAASDNFSFDTFTQQQFQSFEDACQLLQKKTGYAFLKHIANSSAIHRHKNAQLDMVRLGIGLYGVDNNAEMQQHLWPVATLKTTIAQIKKVPTGNSVGYNRAAVLTKDSLIATVRIGYADGYPRSLGNGEGYMLVNNQMAPVIGNVCMDMTMLDVTDIAAKEEDEVIVFGKNLSVTQVAHWAQTIPYEILTGVSQRVKRVYFEE